MGITMGDLRGGDDGDGLAANTRAARWWLSSVARGERAALTARGLPVAALDAVPVGRTMAIAGLVAVLQQPPTAKGTAFVSLEDETGLGNAVLTPNRAKRWRAVLHAAPLVLITGPVHRKGPVASVQATRVEPWWPTG